MYFAKLRTFGLIALTALFAFAALPAKAQDKEKPADEPKAKEEQQTKDGKDLVPLDIKLPPPVFKGTPKHVPPGANLEAPRKGPRPPFLAPKGCKNLALGKKITSSDMEPIIGDLKLPTDGDASAKEGTYVELGPGLQWVQIDLGQPSEIYAVLVWHFHMNAQIYHDVVVQVADDADFIKNVRTIYNNDHDNSSGLGLGTEKEYWETFEGRLMDAKGVVARYVRLYSNGSTADDQNHYTEIEIYGIPKK